MPVYLYTYIPIYIYTYIPIYLYTYIPIYLYTPIHLYTHMPVYLYTYVPIYVFTYMPVYLYAYIPICFNVCIPIYLYTYTPILLLGPVLCVPVVSLRVHGFLATWIRHFACSYLRDTFRACVFLFASLLPFCLFFCSSVCIRVFALFRLTPVL